MINIKSFLFEVVQYVYIEPDDYTYVTLFTNRAKLYPSVQVFGRNTI